MKKTLSRNKRIGVIAALALGVLVASNTACRATIPNRDPLGQALPLLQGESLEQDPVSLPLAEPTIVLAGYVQDAQFDADRWLIGLLQVLPPARILEVPAVGGLFPRMISNTIDSGMRSGIPSEDWASVVTLYGDDASRMIEFTGNEGPRNIRVLLVDSTGQVVWFHDRGFSAAKLLELDRAVRALAPPE